MGNLAVVGNNGPLPTEAHETDGLPGTSDAELVVAVAGPGSKVMEKNFLLNLAYHETKCS